MNILGQFLKYFETTFVAIIRAEIWLEQVQYRMPQQEVTGGS